MNLKNHYIITIIIILFGASLFLLRQKPSTQNNETIPYIIDMPSLPSDMPFLMDKIVLKQPADYVCDIIDYGAIGDGKTLNTQSFKNAITTCAEKGGGTVKVPTGEWLTGAIHLESNINLHLEKDANIIFATDFSNYLPAVFSRFEGIELYNYSPLIYAADKENISITGEGTLNGQGKAWWGLDATAADAKNILYSMAQREIPPAERLFATPESSLRPAFIEFINSRNILIEGINMINSPMWNIHPVYSENVVIRNISIKSSGPNTDGIAIDSTRNVIIDNVHIDSGDDAIAIKSGKDADGIRIGKPSENILVKNSFIKDGHSGFAIGSEMSGGVKNILIDNLTINWVAYGIQLKSTLGRGGIVENIWARNIKIHRAVNNAIRVDMTYGTPQDPNSKEAPIFRNINFENIQCRRTSNAIFLAGLPQSPINGISFKDISISSRVGIKKNNVINESISNSDISSQDN